MRMAEMTIRFANKNDIEKIAHVQNCAYQYGWQKGSEDWQSAVDTASRLLPLWRVLLKDNEIIGAIQYGSRKSWLRIGKSKIAQGGIGEIGIMPEHQGKGYGTYLMKNTLEWMKTEEYDISRLTVRTLSLATNFYSRFGYLIFPKRYVEFHVENKLPIPEAFNPKIRPFNPPNDL